MRGKKIRENGKFLNFKLREKFERFLILKFFCMNFLPSL